MEWNGKEEKTEMENGGEGKRSPRFMVSHRTTLDFNPSQSKQGKSWESE